MVWGTEERRCRRIEDTSDSLKVTNYVYVDESDARRMSHIWRQARFQGLEASVKSESKFNKRQNGKDRKLCSESKISKFMISELAV